MRRKRSTAARTAEATRSSSRTSTPSRKSASGAAASTAAQAAASTGFFTSDAHDARAFLREAQRAVRADPRRRARDQRHLAIEPSPSRGSSGCPLVGQLGAQRAEPAFDFAGLSAALEEAAHRALRLGRPQQLLEAEALVEQALRPIGLGREHGALGGCDGPGAGMRRCAAPAA